MDCYVKHPNSEELICKKRCQTEAITGVSLRAVSVRPSVHVTDFQSLLSSETKDDGVPWLMFSPMPTPSPGQTDGAWGSVQSVLGQSTTSVSRARGRAAQPRPGIRARTCCGSTATRRGGAWG